MILKTLNGQQFKSLVSNGAKNLRLNYEEVDKLNVFPVPDGDTGTNMCRTIENGVNALDDITDEALSSITKPLSSGMLLGARGNSGVILSQIFRGICKGLQNKNEVTVSELASAYKLGVKQAYGAVVTPVEGTILTVFREATEYACKKITEESTINDFYRYHLEQASKTLAKTIDLLPVLKEAGVIDSGGAGYVYIAEGMVKYLDGEEIAVELAKSGASQEVNNAPINIDFDAFGQDDILQYGYCTEFILRLQSSKVDIDSFDVQTVIDILNGDDIKGDSIVATSYDSILKVHVHTMDPGLVLSKMRKFGEFLTVKIENMSLQHNETMGEEELNEKRKVEHKKYAIVAVAQGAGIKQQFEEFGVDYVIGGGQTMNPSTEDFIKAFKMLDAENIIVFPNNKNIVMAAKQAAKLYKGAHIEVVMSTSIPQCFSALTMLDYSSDDLVIILGNFNEAIRHVTSGEITTSIRNTKVNGVLIRKGDNIGILDGKLVVANRNKINCFVALLRKVKNIKDKEVLTIIFGKNVTEDEQNKLMNTIYLKFPHLEVGSINGGQDVYDYLFAVE
ncbi:MAG: DAK2 domain-containing protein [Acholeplasmatales bacterium]|nr:DAK2 domain-containing protein [Acholeplasmatales bacterium]